MVKKAIKKRVKKTKKTSNAAYHKIFKEIVESFNKKGLFPDKGYFVVVTTEDSRGLKISISLDIENSPKKYIDMANDNDYDGGTNFEGKMERRMQIWFGEDNE